MAQKLVTAAQLDIPDVQSAIGILEQQPVRLATKSETLSGLAIIDGVQTVDGDRVLLHDVGNLTSGLWVVHSGAWTRPTDFDSEDAYKLGLSVYVLEGASYRGSTFRIIRITGSYPSLQTVWIPSSVVSPWAPGAYEHPPYAPGAQSIAIGYGADTTITEASAEASVAIGRGARAKNFSDIVIGSAARSGNSGSAAIVIGNTALSNVAFNTASTGSSIMIGSNVGNQTPAGQAVSNCIGIGSNASPTNSSIAIGTTARSALGSSQSIMIGATSTGFGFGSISVGSNSNAGPRSVALGYNSATGPIGSTKSYNTVIGGADAIANGNNVTIVGASVNSGTLSNVAVLGAWTAPDFDSEVVLSSGSRSVSGDRKISLVKAWAATNDATQTNIRLSDLAQTTTPTRPVVLKINTSYIFELHVVARSTTTGLLGAKFWKYTVCVDVGPTTATIIGTPVSTVLAETGASAATWDFTTAISALTIQFLGTGNASQTVNWIVTGTMTKIQQA